MDAPRGVVASTNSALDAALIVAAVNALPELIAAVRGVAALADDLDTEARDDDATHVVATCALDKWEAARRIRAVLAAALDGQAGA